MLVPNIVPVSLYWQANYQNFSLVKTNNKLLAKVYMFRHNI